ncbi:MAG: hypothetical protein Q9224_001319, partial [Gallowayella concinna]
SVCAAMELALRGLKDLPDLQIQDAIAQDEWRHALQLIEKRERRLKKGQTNDWLAVPISLWHYDHNQVDKTLDKGL